jgi:aspartyl-tRNA(Asn)/glutamyl-tRNA(Gln) amidotransferase subunit B
MTVASAELLDYDEVISRYDPVMGMEVHVELSTATKMFCGCANKFGAEPNTQVCPVCLGLPGSLPVINAAAVESAIRIGLALNCDIAPWGRFARKNYFYPDQPKNYQISQYDEPIAINGYLDVPLDDGTTWRVDIERAHMEEDTGKLTHLGSDTGRIEGATTSLLDYNRAGVPLVEIVTKPIEGAGERAPQIARAYVTALRDLLRALDVSDVRMDQGSMRVDSNLSLKPIGAVEFGTRTETKNVNSLKSVEVAVRYEMRRQAALLEAGGRIIQETRHFHEDGYTTAGRSKETAQDYRYFPEPDLEPVAPSAELVEQLRGTIPELPWLSRKRIQDDWGISDEVMRDLVNNGVIDLVTATVAAGASSEAARAWWGNFLVQKANEAGIEIDALAITPAQVAAVVKLIDGGTLSNKLARQVIEGVLAGEGEPEQVMADRGLAVVRDDSVIQAAVDEALAANPDIAEKIRSGKVAAAGAIVGAVAACS